jgi:hypothetical protein
MFPINAQSIPVEKVMDYLLVGGGLRELSKNGAVACFALARSMVAKTFYLALIENIETIDATTREHVHFFVFFGSRVGLVHNVKGIQAPVRHPVEGLSVSTSRYADNSFDIFVPRDGASALQLPEHIVPSYDPPFHEPDFGIRNALHSGDPLPPDLVYEKHMARATTHLAEHYDIRENQLPCLLFVDPVDTRRKQVVPLDQSDPLKSLYKDVLVHLSDEFRGLQSLWKEQSDERKRQYWIADSPIQHTRLSAELAQAQVSLSRLQTLEQPAIHRAVLKVAAAHGLDKAVSVALSMIDDLLPGTQGDRFRALAEELAALETELARFRAATKTDPLFPDNQTAHRRWETISTELGNTLADLRRAHLQAASNHHNNRASARNTVEALKQSLDRQLEKHAKLTAESRAAAVLIVEKAEALKVRGYSDAVLEQEGSYAYPVVEQLNLKGLLGARPERNNNGEGELRILFLAADPLDTARIDLEEEVRSIQRELRATDHRRSIRFVASHAARPDDLVAEVGRLRPTIVHFSGHGAKSGIAFRSDSGGHHIVTGEALRRFFLGRGVKLVVLNSCLSRHQADAIATAVSTVVGTDEELDDEAAGRFSVAFYRQIGNGGTIGDAFRDGRDAVGLYDLPEAYVIMGDQNVTLLANSAAATTRQH